MPYTQLNTDFGGHYRLQAAMQIGDQISKALERYDEEKRKKEFNQGVFDQVQTERDLNGNPLVTPDILEKWNSVNPDKQAGMLSGILAKRQENYRIAEARSRAWQPDPATLDRMRGLGFDWAQTSRAAGQWKNVRAQDLPAPGTPEYDEERNQIGVYDARGKIVKIKPSAAQQERAAELSDLDAQIADLQAEMAKGNQKSWNPFSTPYADQLRGLLVKRAGLSGGGAAPKAAPSEDGGSRMEDSAPAAPAAPAVKVSDIVSVSTPAEAAALPPGTRYKTPDGRVFLR